MKVYLFTFIEELSAHFPGVSNVSFLWSHQLHTPEFTKDKLVELINCSHQIEVLCLLGSSILGSRLVGYQAPANIVFKIILPFRTTYNRGL